MNQKPLFTYLSNEERSEIEILHGRGYSARAIGRVLGRSPNTISLELKRVPSGYKATLAKQYVKTNLKNRRFQWQKINKCIELRNYIIAGLKEDWSPDEIAGRMKESNQAFYACKDTIYQWLDTARGNKYKKYLYSNRPGRRHKKSGNQGKIPALVPISERPEIINTRSRGGDWETDLIVSKRGTTTAISSNIDRKSRYLVANKVLDQTAYEKQKTLHVLIEGFLVHSMTYDRGHENVKHSELGVATYFCNPYSSWEKGSIENANKCLRRYIPKKTDLSTITEKKLQEYVNKINNKPRKILGYKTALEVATELGLFKKVINRVS